MLEAGQHHGGGGGGRQAERQQRHERAGGGRIVGGLRPGDALDGALAEFLRVLRQPLLGRVGQEGRDLRAAGGKRADGESEGRSAQPGLPRALPVLLGHPERAADGLELLLMDVAARGDVERFADREEADGQRRHLDVVVELRHAEAQAGLAGEDVDADEAEQ